MRNPQNISKEADDKTLDRRIAYNGPSRSLSFHCEREKVSVDRRGSSGFTSSYGKHLKVPLPRPPILVSPLASPTGSNPRRNNIECKIAVIGKAGVGKSAIVVRLLTGRYIWEYDPTLEAYYKYSTSIDDERISMEILDTAGLNDGEICDSHGKWADGFAIVFSVTDPGSFSAVQSIHTSISALKHTPNFPCVLLANKQDLDHLREVDREQIEDFAGDLGVSLFVVSASEGSPDIHEAFAEVYRDVVRRRYSRRRKSSAKVVIEGFYKMFSR